MIDSHAHLQDERFGDDLDEVLARAFASGISHIVCVGYDLESSRQAVRMAEDDVRILATVGIHPHEAEHTSDDHIEELYRLARHPRVVAVGEIGLDYYYDAAFKEEQSRWFRAQIRVAKEVGKPVVIHDRDAHLDTLRILSEENAGKNGGVMHCYSGSPDMLNDFIRLGFFISLAGPLTFKNARKAVEVARSIALDRLLVETDCPYLSPEPFRGKLNEPVRVWEVARKIAEVKGIDLEEVERVTDQNCRRLFKLE